MSLLSFIKPKTILKASNTDSSSGPDDSSKNKKSIGAFIEKYGKEFGESILLILLAAGVAYLVRYIAGRLLADSNIGFVWLEIIKLVVTIMILVAIASIAKSSRLGKAVAIFAIIFFVQALVTHDYPEKVVVEQTSRAKNANIGKSIDYLRLAPGTHKFKMDEGQFTPWRAFPIGRATSGFSSESYDYTIHFTDGTSYPGDPNGRIPHKVDCFWKIEAHSPQTVYVTVLLK